MALSLVSLIRVVVGFGFCNLHNNLSSLRIIIYFYSMRGAKLPYASRFFRQSDFCLYGVSCCKHLACRNSIIHSATSHHSKYQNKGRVFPSPSVVSLQQLPHTPRRTSSCLPSSGRWPQRLQHWYLQSYTKYRTRAAQKFAHAAHRYAHSP